MPDGAARAEWLAKRQRHVGGSEIASLFYAWSIGGRIVYRHMFEPPPPGAEMLGCVSRHTTGYRLWAQKSGLLPVDDLSQEERVAAGVHLEPGIARWAMSTDYAPGWGMQLRKARRYLAKSPVSGLGASRDYEEIAPGYPPVELKNVDSLIFRDLWQAEDETITAPPIDITLQLQHQIAADGCRAECGWIIACVGGNRLLRGKIARHDGTIARIYDAVTAFWAAVDEGRPPLDVADYDTIAEITATGAKADAVDLRGDPELPGLCAEFLDAAATLESAERHRDRVKGAICGKLGEIDRAFTDGYRLSWAQVNGVHGPHRGRLIVTPTTIRPAPYAGPRPLPAPPQVPRPINLAAEAPLF